MTIEIDGLADAVVAAEIAAWIGGAAFLLMGAFFFYLLVRPVRRKGPPAEPEPEGIDAAELRDLVDRIEGRLEMLERIVSTEREHPVRIEERKLEETGAEPETRRTK